MNSKELLNKLGYWEKKEFEAEQQATFARTQQARIVGELAMQNIHLMPPLEPDEPEIE